MISKFCKLFATLTASRHAWDVWGDWLVMASTALRNGCPEAMRCEVAEAEYMAAVGRYTAEQARTMAQLLAVTVEALEAGPHDFLGRVFHELELHNSAMGQFFTPYDLCRAMARINGFERPADGRILTACEPACGSGATMIALHEIALEGGFADRVYYELTDLDDRAFRMAYIQCTLLGMAARVVRGDTLRMRFDREWFTAGYYLHNMAHRRRRTDSVAACEAARELIGGDDVPDARGDFAVDSDAVDSAESSVGQLCFDF